MGYITTTFLGKEYTIPEDVLIYIDLLDFAENVKKQLVNAFIRKLNAEISKGNTACLDDKDLSTEIEQQVGRFIAKLCDNGIFNRTINDYLKNNKGYQLFSDVNKAALEKMKSLLIREMDSWQAGFEEAIQKKESSVTGMGFSIWSSSFINHAIYAAMEASTVNKQEKAATVQYQKDMDELRARLDSQYGAEKSAYVHNTYIPNMEAALTVFAYELLDKYVADLIADGKFDAKTLDYVDISRSNDLLKNLTLSNNKKVILENAFAACPYNIAVYMQAMKYEMLDFNSFQTAKIFMQQDLILSFLNESWGEVSFPAKFNINYYCIDVWATFTGKTSMELLRSLTDKYAAGIVKAYSRVAEMLNNKQLCRKVIGDCSEDAILTGDAICKTKAHSYVDTIVSSTIWSQLIEKCGHPDLLDRIKKCISSPVDASSKGEYDKYLVEQLYSVFATERRILAAEIETQRKTEAAKKAEQEKQEQERRKRNKKITAIVTPIIAVAIVFIIILNTVIVPSSKYKKAVELYNGGEYKSALAAFSALEGYKDSDSRVLECKCSLALELYNEGNYDDAKDILLSIQDYADANRLIGDCYMRIGDYEAAISAYGTTDIVIPDGITHIKAEAFKGFDTLTSITIPSSVTSIGQDAFEDCHADIYVNDIAKWCGIEFSDYSASPMLYGEDIYLNGELFTEVDIPNDVTEISNCAFAFWDCLTNIVVPDSVRNIGSYAFASCDNLERVVLPSRLTTIEDYTFAWCDHLSQISIPNTVTRIGEYAFTHCYNLTDISIPEGISKIEMYTFSNCTSLKEIALPESVTSIDQRAFSNCESLKTIAIPKGVTKLGESVFEDCTNLTRIEFGGTINDWMAIEKASDWDNGIRDYSVYCVDGQISANQIAMLECKVGDVITFGSYEQDGSLNNGTEAIEWLVLERNGNKALVISLYCLDQKPFNETLTAITWEKCTLRKWLNSDFYKSAFTTDEQARIISSTIPNPDSFDQEKNGASTVDKVFLLSAYESEKYFDSDSAREAYATDYVSTSHCYWFLRTVASIPDMVVYVDHEGNNSYAENVNRNWWVRPAMWIEIGN